MNSRIENDNIREISVLDAKLWGPATQRSLENFNIGKEKMPCEIIETIVMITKNGRTHLQNVAPCSS